MIVEELKYGLITSFIDQASESEETYQTKLVQNNYPMEKVIQTFEAELEQCKRFWFTTAFLSMSGFNSLYTILKNLQEREIPGQILVSQYLNFTDPAALRRLSEFKNIELRIDTKSSLHAKSYIFESNGFTSLLLGSSNLTGNALCKNQEINILIRALPESKVIKGILLKQRELYESAEEVTKEYLEKYSNIYQQNRIFRNNEKISQRSFQTPVNIEPNLMQNEALDRLSALRKSNQSKALVISATGTGKTILAALDVRSFKPKRMLYVVHRENILLDAQKTFEMVIGKEFHSEILSGSLPKINLNKNIFATIQSISKDDYLKQFAPDAFDYIIIDESHRSGAKSYVKVLEYFNAKFLLGLTATPERNDGYDIFQAFDHNIAYEIRLKKAMECNLVSSFHYFGISEIKVNGQLLTDNADFRYLTSDERVSKIKEASDKFGTDSGELRALVFCSRVDEAKTLALKMTQLGLKSIALSGDNSVEDRVLAIDSVSGNNEDRIKMIFTVDIFNEGIDIPAINQVIFLRSTNSSIIYIQQLGRGLRKFVTKEFLTVIDFIGAYEKNYLIPMAIYGDSTFNKDILRKMVSSGGYSLPGASTIHFDKISREKIFESINNANFQHKTELENDYNLLKSRIGRMPLMKDFVDSDLRDPWNFVVYSRSYYNFVNTVDSVMQKMSSFEEKLLEFYSLEINNSRRVLESLLLEKIINYGPSPLTLKGFRSEIYYLRKIVITNDDFISAVNNLNMNFYTHKYFKINGNVQCIENKDNEFFASKTFLDALKNESFKLFLYDNVKYAIDTYFKDYSPNNFAHGFLYYRKYSRRDVFRILNWSINPNPQNVGGYLARSDKASCPIFVTYHKSDEISDTIKYEDKFINLQYFQWMSKSKRKLTSSDVKIILESKTNNTLLPLFIKKDDDEGADFYFIGLLSYVNDSAEETYLQTENKPVSVVKMKFKLDRPVDISLYTYLTGNHTVS